MAPIAIAIDGFMLGRRRVFGVPDLRPRATTAASFGNWRDVKSIEAYILEAWGQGFMFGALLIMSVITIANMKKGVLLHKLILLELLLAMSHGTFCFMSFDGYGWYLSSTAALLYCSYFTHNVVAWLKIRPFFTGPQPFFSPPYSVWVPRVYLATLALTIPALIFEIYNNFRFFNNLSRLYATVRPYEPLMRDPWWLFSCATLLHVIRRSYSLRIVNLVRKSPRFGIMLVAIFLAIVFTIVDILSTIVTPLSLTDGINPYWKLALVFKCLTDNILLDDFKSVLQKLGAMKVDGTNTTLAEVGSLQTHDKIESCEHHENNFPGNGPTALSNDSRASDQIGLANALNDGPDMAAVDSERKRGNANGLGKYGVKINKLPSLPFSGSGKKSTKES